MLAANGVPWKSLRITMVTRLVSCFIARDEELASCGSVIVERLFHARKIDNEEKSKREPNELTILSLCLSFLAKKNAERSEVDKRITIELVKSEFSLPIRCRKPPLRRKIAKSLNTRSTRPKFVLIFV